MSTPTLDEQIELAKTYCPDMLDYLKRMEKVVGGHCHIDPERSMAVKEIRRGGPPEWVRKARIEIMEEMLNEWREALEDY